MRFELVDQTHKESHVMVSHGIPRVGEEIILEIEDTFRPFRVTRVIWFVRKSTGDPQKDIWVAIPIPSIEVEEIPKKVNNEP